MFLLLKSKSLPAGTKRKWKDGVYIKGSDHKWHKEKSTAIAHAQLKADNKHKDKDLVEDFTEAVHNYIDHLHENDIHPSHAGPATDDEFWAEFFDDADWDDNPSYLKFAKKVNGVAKKFHSKLQADLKREHIEDEKHAKKMEAEQKKEEKRGKEGAKKIAGRGTVTFKNEIHAAKAASMVATRRSTHEYASKYLDGKPIQYSSQASSYIGFAVEVNGVKGVFMNFYTMKQRNGYRQRLTEIGIPTLVILTPDGPQKVSNQGPVKILADPTSAKSSVEIVGSVKASGISEIVFDSDISSYAREDWNKRLKAAFVEFNKVLGISFKDQIKIHVYGSRGPIRGALADYSSKEKVIRLSSAKAGSFEALAHELGHALDDKMSGWYGTGSYQINEVVRAYRATEQGKSEADRLKAEKTGSDAYSLFGRRRRVSNYTAWMNKPEEIFARCFETYVAHKCKGWVRDGWAKKAVDDESFIAIKPLFDKLLKDKKVKKAIIVILGKIQRR